MMILVGCAGSWSWVRCVQGAEERSRWARAGQGVHTPGGSGASLRLVARDTRVRLERERKARGDTEDSSGMLAASSTCNIMGMVTYVGLSNSNTIIGK